MFMKLFNSSGMGVMNWKNNGWKQIWYWRLSSKNEKNWLDKGYTKTSDHPHSPPSTPTHPKSTSTYTPPIKNVHPHSSTQNTSPPLRPTPNQP